MRYLLRSLAAVVVLLLYAAPTLAQGRLIFEDETGNLDRERIEEAAQSLIDRDAEVAIYMVSEGSEADFLQRLESDGLVREGLARTRMIAIYVGLDNRYSAIRFGDDWNAALSVNDNFDVIRETELGPGLAAGNYTDGYVDALSAINTAIESPPSPGGGNIFNVDINFIPIVVGVFVLLIAVTSWRIVSRQRTAKRALTDARTRFAEARQGAGSAIADMGQFFKNAQAKTEYDRVSYAPADVDRLAQGQQEIATRFAGIQTRFDDIGETIEQQAKPKIPQYDEAVEQYSQVQQDLVHLRTSLASLDEQRAELDRLAQQTPIAIDQAQRKLTAVSDQLVNLQADIPDADAVIAPIQQYITEAEQQQAVLDARSAIASAQQAEAQAQEISSTLETFTTIQAGINEGRNDAEQLIAQGYRIEDSHTALDEAQAALAEAAQALQREGIEPATLKLQVAQAHLDKAIAQGRGLAELHAENERRLAEIEARGHEIGHVIAEGHKTFDIVDEFAESTWSDIRGNGSEAEAAADRAHEHWLNARQHNMMELQEFTIAKEDLDIATEELEYARSLVDAIIQRLHDLEAARDTARSELSAAAADITRGWEFVRKNDPDVGQGPEQKLRQAEALLAQAQEEIKQTKPDWLELVKHAQAANNLADDALAGARSEVEAMEKLRNKAQRMQQLAGAEVQKIVKFAKLHNQDIQPSNQQAIERTEHQLQQAHTLMQEAERAHEGQRMNLLKLAYEMYTQLQTDAAQVYSVVYADFQQLEQLRNEVNHALTRARNAIVSAERTLVNYSSVVPRNASLIQQLRTARRRFEQIKLPISGESNLQSTLTLAESIQQDAQAVEEEIRQYYRPPHDGGADDLLTGMMIGTMIDSVSRSERRGGWGGSGSWSGGKGGGWGSLGGGGGSWGGGGGGGGSWGGGGGGGGW